MNTLFMDDQQEITRLKVKVNALLGCLQDLQTRPENTCCCGLAMDEHTESENHAPVNIVDDFIEGVLAQYDREEI